VFYNLEFRGFNKDGEAIATMHKLRSLQLFGNNLTNEGLTAILDNCPHLESLDTLRGKCARIKTLRLPHDSNC
jgi:hypothetical protein